MSKDQIKQFEELLEPLESYQKLKENVEANIGNKVLLVEKEAQTCGIDGCFSSSRTFMHVARLRLGVVQGGIELVEGRKYGPYISLNTGDYAEKKTDFYKWNIFDERKDSKGTKGDWELFDGPLNICHSDFVEVDVHGRRFMEKEKILSFFGGEVDDYFQGERPIRSKDLSYIEALELLGLEVPSVLRKEYDEKRHRDKVFVIKRLEELFQEEEALKAKIDNVRAKKGRHFLIESDVDVAFLTWGEREKLDEINREIHRYLESAIKRDMHKEPLVIEWKRPGITIDVPLYITKLCEDCKIEL
jgi:hypothetical protein